MDFMLQKWTGRSEMPKFIANFHGDFHGHVECLVGVCVDWIWVRLTIQVKIEKKLVTTS